MHYKKVLFISALIAALTLFGSGGQVWAGGPENPPTSGTIGGPELWGEMTIDCGNGILSLRVKRIVDCNVETQAFMDPTYALGCPANETTPVYRKLGVTLFDINPDPNALDPIITKVKNFKQEAAPNDSIYSFDVQIKFYTP